MLALYILHDNETFRYIKHTLYKLENTKIAFEHYRLINPKLCQPTIIYPKIYAISNFIQCIWDYGSALNNNTANSEAMYKDILKAFYNKMNQKEYDSQIR